MIEEVDPNEKGGRRGKSEIPQSGTPVLDNFSRDLIKLAEEGKLDPVIGRDREISRIAQILSRRKKNNPIIIGEPGCGKTAIVEGLAMKIFQGDCPQNLADKRIVSLDMTSIVAGTKYRGQFEERLKVFWMSLMTTLRLLYSSMRFIQSSVLVIHQVRWMHPTSLNPHLLVVNFNVLVQPHWTNTVRTSKRMEHWSVVSKR